MCDLSHFYRLVLTITSVKSFIGWQKTKYIFYNDNEMAADQNNRKEVYLHAVILGAGISGLVAAKIINSGDRNRILIIDEYDRIGGNHIDCDFGAFTFDIGTLIFQDDSPLMKYFPELLPFYLPIDYTISRVTSDNAIREYPLSMKDEVYGVGLIRSLQLFGSIAWGRCRWRKFESADDYARFWIGSKLFETSGLAHYIKRFYGAPATAIDPVFAEKRMGWLAEGASLQKNIKKIFVSKSEAKPGQSFVRPRTGFGELYGAARETLEREGTNFALGESLNSITRQGNSFLINTDRLAIKCERVISTIPVERAYGLCGFGGLAPLPASKLISLFFTFVGDRGFQSAILYNFSDRGLWKRLTMFSDFFGKVEGREYLGVEVIGNDEVVDATDRDGSSFRFDADSKGLFRGSLDFVGSHELDNAYPIYLHGAMDRANDMIASLRAFGVEFMGRQGAFDYLPTARQVTLAVEKSLSDRHE